nr:Putative secreted protein [Kibdelosporangium sp. MJ126-NF4]
MLGAVIAVLAVGAPRAGAHGVSDTADFHLAQSFAGNELTLVVRRTQDVPGPLTVDFIAHNPVVRTSIEVGLVGSARKSTVDIVNRGTRPVRLDVDRTGRWELTLSAASGEQARIPFQVMQSRLTLWEPVAYGGLAATGLFMAVALITAVFSRRRMLVVLPAGAGVVALTVAVTAALLSSAIPPAQAEGAIPVDPTGGRPYVNASIGTDRSPVTGTEFVLGLTITDGNTGRPADDLIAHHDALAHLVVSSVDGQFFRHLHMVRSAPGDLGVRLAVDRPGRYLVHAEFERVNSGSQLVTGSFEATGPVLGGDTPKEARQAVAGRGHTVEMSVGGRADLQPWLGMAGHLVLRDESGGFFGHVHEMGPMRRNADETVASLQPRLRFTFTFPKPGRYFGWVQYQRDYTVTTVPLVVDVRPS